MEKLIKPPIGGNSYYIVEYDCGCLRNARTGNISGSKHCIKQHRYSYLNCGCWYSYHQSEWCKKHVLVKHKVIVKNKILEAEKDLEMLKIELAVIENKIEIKNKN